MREPVLSPMALCARKNPIPGAPCATPSASEKIDKPRTAKGKSQLAADKSQNGKRRMAYRDKRDLELLPSKIEMLEAEIGKLHAAIAEPRFYSRPANEIAREQINLKELTQQLAAAYKRWEELELLAD